MKSHGKPSLTDRISLRKKFWIFGISSVQRNHTLSIIKFLHLVIDIFNIIAFISKESTFGYRQKGMCVSKNVKCNSGITDIGGSGQFINGKT